MHGLSLSTMEGNKLHVVMIPWLAFGHMIPFLELSKCLAKRGHRISFISTPRNIDRLLPRIPPHLSHLINLVKLSPPHLQGLPNNAEATSDLPPDENHYIKKLQDEHEGPFRTFLKDQDPTPDWIIYDMGVFWAPLVADEFGLPSAFYCILNATTLSFIGPPSMLLASPDERSKMTPEHLMVPPPWVTFPTKVAYKYHEAAQIIKNYRDDDYRLGTSFQRCNIVAIRSSVELEPESLSLLAALYQKPVFPVGFLSPSLHEEDGEAVIWEEGKWLDTQKHGFTVYVAFGSEFRLSQEQLTELALGLELSELPFVWAYRKDSTQLPMGFEDRTKGRGVVVMGMAPQTMFLAHPSVGGFLTHCGWGSTVEGLSFGKPLIMLPMMADQGLNTRIVEERKAGVEVSRNERDGSFTRHAVAKALRLVMVESEGECIRANAREMQKIFGDKVRDDRYIDDFVKHLICHRRSLSKLTKGV